ADIERLQRQLDVAFGKPLRDLTKAIHGGGRERGLGKVFGRPVKPHRRPPNICAYLEPLPEQSPSPRSSPPGKTAGGQSGQDAVGKDPAHGDGRTALTISEGSGPRIATWDVETLSAFIDERVVDKKKVRTPRGETTCERLRKLMQEDPKFVIESPERQLARRIGRKSPGCFSGSSYWHNTVKKMRALHRAKTRDAVRGTKRDSAFMTLDQARSANYDQREYREKLEAEIDQWRSDADADPDSAVDGGH
ncbi:MAG: hypothetical protein EBS90_13880, partial [Betaproteobacteria bacterium]|nr:hypothetical protein [Betaproteobacteria bacterium]